MSISGIFERIGSHFDLSQDSFHVQIYDERFRDYIDFDDEYAEELQQRLPRTSTAALNVRVIHWCSDVADEAGEFSAELRCYLTVLFRFPSQKISYYQQMKSTLI
jgi:hypothetical protein